MQQIREGKRKRKVKGKKKGPVFFVVSLCSFGTLSKARKQVTFFDA
jgi:hypothetical protein